MCRWKKVQYKGKIKMKKTRENFPLIIFFYLFDGKKINNLKDFHLGRKREKEIRGVGFLLKNILLLHFVCTRFPLANNQMNK